MVKQLTAEVTTLRQQTPTNTAAHDSVLKCINASYQPSPPPRTSSKPFNPYTSKSYGTTNPYQLQGYPPTPPPRTFKHRGYGSTNYMYNPASNRDTEHVPQPDCWRCRQAGHIRYGCRVRLDPMKQSLNGFPAMGQDRP